MDSVGIERPKTLVDLLSRGYCECVTPAISTATCESSPRFYWDLRPLAA